MDTGGTNLQDFAQMLLALAFVVALMGGLSYLVRKLGIAGAATAAMNNKDSKRLRVVERLPLDPRRQAILLARDNIEHLIILGPDGQTLIESNIRPNDFKQTDTISGTEKE